jgi:hypothetical protein
LKNIIFVKNFTKRHDDITGKDKNSDSKLIYDAKAYIKKAKRTSGMVKEKKFIKKTKKKSYSALQLMKARLIYEIGYNDDDFEGKNSHIKTAKKIGYDKRCY